MEAAGKHNTTTSKTAIFTMVFGICVLGRLSVNARELEPRSISNAPVGTFFLALAYGYASGNVLFDPSLPIEDVKKKMKFNNAQWVNWHTQSLSKRVAWI